MHDIKGFRGEYSWLSNMALLDEPIVYQDIKYGSVENFYQAMKTIRMHERQRMSELGPKTAKAYSRGILLREGWNDIKLKVMRFALEIKFSQEKFKALLEATGDCYIEETNTWGDTFWGVCKGRGENNLGKLIMDIRERNRANGYYYM